jgi:hypothetical protein
VEKKQSDLYRDVLCRLDKEGVLSHVLLIGSWCGQLYKHYFKTTKYTPIIRTRDIDFLIPLPPRFNKKVDLREVFQALGFNLVFKGRSGYVTFEHPNLIIEFLVPERGRGSDKPYPIPDLGINAQSLRFLDLLAQNTVRIPFEDVTVTVPHPANFAIQKLIISTRRTKPEKRDKDRALAIEILKTLFEVDEAHSITQLMQSLPKKWQKLARQALIETTAPDTLTSLFNL